MIREIFDWIIAWDLVLEFRLGAADECLDPHQRDRVSPWLSARLFFLNASNLTPFVPKARHGGSKELKQPL